MNSVLLTLFYNVVYNFVRTFSSLDFFIQVVLMLNISFFRPAEPADNRLLQQKRFTRSKVWYVWHKLHLLPVCVRWSDRLFLLRRRGGSSQVGLRRQVWPGGLVTLCCCIRRSWASASAPPCPKPSGPSSCTICAEEDAGGEDTIYSVWRGCQML